MWLIGLSDLIRALKRRLGLTADVEFERGLEDGVLLGARGLGTRYERPECLVAVEKVGERSTLSIISKRN
jgi:hypothetical protein